MATKQYLASNCSNLLSLRNLLKRDPGAYVAEFQQQAAHLRSLIETQVVDLTSITGIDQPTEAMDPGAARAQSQHDRHVADVIEFVAHCLPLYWDTLNDDVGELPKVLLAMVRDRAATMSSALRRAIVQALALLRNRGVLASIDLLPVWFALFEIPDKALRLLVFGDLVSNLVRIEDKGLGAEQRAHRCLVYELIGGRAGASHDKSEIQRLKALGVAVELFRKNVWRNEKTANIIAEAVFSASSKMSTAALRFLLCDSFTDDADEEGGERLGLSIRAAISKIRENQCGANVGSKKKKRERAIERAKEKLKKAEKKQSLGPKAESGPISMIYDPQTFAERLFSKLRTTKEAFSVRQLMMSVISRLVNEHSLFLLNLYPFLQRYLQAHVKNVTTIMSFLVQSCHSKIPPDVLEPIIKAIADQFVNDRSRPEAMAVGINSIRAICARQPLCMNATLLQDLAQYKDHRDKSVVIAARSLIGLFRQVNPLLLHKKDRGRLPEDIPVQREFGEEHIPSDVPGVDLLQLEKSDAVTNADEWDENESVSEHSDEDEDDDFSDSDESAPSLLDEEEAAEFQEKLALAESLQKQASIPLGAVEILTPKDFELLEKLEKEKKAAGVSAKRIYTEEGTSVNPTDLEASSKRKRRRLEERLELIKTNQEERKQMFTPGGKKGGNSATNEEKKRLKPFMLTKHSRSVREKLSDSQLSKQVRSGIHASKKRKSAKNSHKKKRRRF